jgi:hypothetical protein
MAPERRDVLRAGGGVAALLTGLAGCTERIDDVTGGGGPDTPPYAGAMLDPAAVLDVETRGFVSVDAAAYREQRAALPEAFRRSVESAAGDVESADTEDADRLSGVVGNDRGEPRNRSDDRNVSVGLVTGEFDPEAIGSQLAENETLTEQGEYEGYTLYGGAPEYDLTQTVAVGVSASTLVGATVNVATPEDAETSDGYGGPDLSATPSGVPTALDAVRAGIDTAGGGGSPITDDDLAAEVLADLGDSPLAGGVLADGATVRETYFGDGGGGTREPEDEAGQDVFALTQDLVAAAGNGAAPEATSAETTVRLYYGSEDIVNDRAETLRSLIETAKSRSEDVTPPETEVTTDGRTVILTVTGDPKQLSEEVGFGEASGGGGNSRSGDSSTEAPQATFSFEYDADNRLTVTHQGGDTVTEDLRIRYESDGEVRVETWPATDGIAAGDTYTTDATVDTGAQVVIIWASDGSGAVLGQSEGPPSE